MTGLNILRVCDDQMVEMLTTYLNEHLFTEPVEVTDVTQNPNGPAFDITLQPGPVKVAVEPVPGSIVRPDSGVE